MRKEDLVEIWKTEEAAAKIHGWDFSHIKGRYTVEKDLPWSYREEIQKYINDEKKILDIDTGGGEFLLSLGHPARLTSATEGYAPNVALCKETLLPLGMDFREARDYEKLPFEDGEFDIVINRHGNFSGREIFRILKAGGIFITQQVGENNDRELVKLLLPGTPKPFHGLNARDQGLLLEQAGFELLKAEEAYRPIRFFDIGALVWFARIIEWEFPGFSVEKCEKRLWEAQSILERTGSVDGTTHRYLLVAEKPH